MTLRKRLHTPEEIAGAIEQMANAILKDCRSVNCQDYAFVGIYQQGVPLAERLCDAIERLTKTRPPMAKLDISLYRDDFGQRSALPLIRETIIPFDVNEMRIILVDDVLSTGRTIRAALDALTDYGRPDVIRLAVLVDRRNPEFPIRADYVGFDCNPPADHKIAVRFDAEDPIENGIFEVEWE
ncbi:MAG: bifunctional pyr operon transcriptional regulator/uracil phosphoribosyltransferase PyrR [Victivallales bacterium]|jgi:pyrimidine operon attenuation protein/uracil phosphoribosyltransferase|nr:bifunctional pyr operon transcriptional regulator/uracil phosphoribosyltransferase PyrR [Victivallales bacterium]